MKFFGFDADTAKPVTHGGSDFAIQPFVRSGGRFQTALMTLGEKGVIAYHQAAVPQLLIVLSGNGTVCNGKAVRPCPGRLGCLLGQGRVA